MTESVKREYDTVMSQMSEIAKQKREYIFSHPNWLETVANSADRVLNKLTRADAAQQGTLKRALSQLNTLRGIVNRANAEILSNAGKLLMLTR